MQLFGISMLICRVAATSLAGNIMDELVITREEFRDRYFKPVRAGTWNVIVKSLGDDYSEAERSLEFFLKRYKSMKLARQE